MQQILNIHLMNRQVYFEQNSHGDLAKTAEIVRYYGPQFIGESVNGINNFWTCFLQQAFGVVIRK